MSLLLQPFVFASCPEIHFGAGHFSKLPQLLSRFGKNVLLVTGHHSFRAGTFYKELQHYCSFAGEASIAKEPSPADIDAIVNQYDPEKIDLILAIGGGSVLDAGKAISAMLPLQVPVQDYLEGIGTQQHPGLKVPMIAIPTTAGTGSEATKNAVLSIIGENGFKKSLRHTNFVPEIALVDPELHMGCPAMVTAYSGMDAFTQLLESYTSNQANTFTDALAERGLFSIHLGLKHAVMHDSLSARAHMAHAALLSGICLANAGLGTIHGFASSIGGLYSIPHGIICARMMHSCNTIAISRLRAKKDTRSLKKFSYAGKLFLRKENKSDKYYTDGLLDIIHTYTEEFSIPRLSEYGVKKEDAPRIISATENKNNPYSLQQEELLQAFEESL
ncbi:MAG: iron-containing alcohol dehydrogenase [Cytophagaceae bacterium]|jgi:alcohol dehydrogenase class IV|nr:iron-containing alcohol dehydrogenase [Cytophagaceae bacterium]